MEKVKSYFQKTSSEFDAIYSPDKNLIQKLLHQMFHRVIEQRFEAAFREFGSFSGKSYLDVGCGSGRYLVEAAKRGASRITGIDFSDNMLAIAGRYLKAADFQGRLSLVNQDFLAYHPDGGKHDYVTAIGYFDYISDPEEHLAKLKTAAKSKIIASFPKRWTVRTLLRKVRLGLMRCPVYFYDRRSIVRLLANAGLGQAKIVSLSRDYLVVMDLNVTDGGK